MSSSLPSSPMRLECARFRSTSSAESEFESVPLNKIEDFGAHQNQYYQLEISYFKSACDTALLNAIWNK